MLRGDATSLDNVAMDAGTTRVYFGKGLQLGLNRIDDEHFSWFLRTQEGTEIEKDPNAVARALHGWADPVERVVAATDVDTLSSVNRFMNRKALAEFAMRVIFQMSANDSASLIDSPKAGTLGLHRALFYNEQEGYLEIFRPYALPDNAWIEQAAASLSRLVK